MTKQHIPKIRFQGFDDEWEEIIIGKNFRVTRGLVLSTSKVSKVFTEDYCFPVYSSQTKNNGLLGFYLDFLFDSAITWTTDGANAGTVKYREGKFYSTNVNGVLLSDKLVANKYIAESLNRIAWKYVSKVGNPKLMNNVMSEIPITISLSLPEQESIGQLFRTLDELISAYKDNLEHYQSLKTSMLYKMFPKEGQKQPEIRLDGFDGDWEVKKLVQVTSRVQGNDGRMDLPTLTISAANGWMNQEDRFSKNIAGKEQKNYTLLKQGELSYNHGNSKLAKYGVVFALDSFDEALVPRVYHSFKVNSLASSKYIEVLFATKRPDRELSKLVSSGARMDGLLNINYNDFSNIKIPLPSLPEQEAIGAFFANLDETISSYKDKIGQLELLKKNLLSQMFI